MGTGESRRDRGCTFNDPKHCAAPISMELSSGGFGRGITLAFSHLGSSLFQS
eukprot:CAMPEP_0172610736 /NCGR_PEP_ID=MMETSP1068-20121228/30507_1 /TAXON_ID=35684 /ORGANISM="Pseudopedinella elastica, Strain CCMP716" /LENGTH=51 /DNA_ID=CAMNT_0013414523 /DNA_START=901 /DNA_END=1056 /DNA_ORIENTATION=-